MKEANAEIPRIIWIMWWQGFDKAPDLVKKCYFSWKKHNPTWKIILLDEKNLDEYIDVQNIVNINRRDITIQKVSNILRINLLKKYGGVWVDATCFCCVPLDTWLSNYTKSGFFAFANPGKDRLFSSWFLVSGKNGYLISKYCDEHNLFWNRNCFSNQYTKQGLFIVKQLSRILNRNSYTTKWWFSWVVLKIIKVYPYFIFHYHFAKIIKEDTLFRRIWNETEKYSADIPHKVLSSGLLQPLSQEIKQYIDNSQSPLYKLTWKYKVDKFSEGCTLHYLLESISITET